MCMNRLLPLDKNYNKNNAPIPKRIPNPIPPKANLRNKTIDSPISIYRPDENS